MRFLRKMNFESSRRTNPAKNQSRSQHSTLQFNFVVLDAIVKTLYLNFVSESTTLNYVHQHSNQHCSRYMRFSRKMNFESPSSSVVVELPKAYQSRHKSKLRLQLSSRVFNIKCYVSSNNVGNKHWY